MVWTCTTKYVANKNNSQIEGIHDVPQGLLDYNFGMLQLDLCRKSPNGSKVVSGIQ